jgi:hypothetical protein
LRAGFIDERQIGQTVRELGKAAGHVGGLLHARQRQPRDLAGHDAGLFVGGLDRSLLDDRIAQPRRVGQQMADRDRRFRGPQIGDRAVRRHLHLHLRELRQHVRQGLVEPQPAFVDQDHRGHAGDRLGHRIDAEQAVHGDGGGFALRFDATRDAFRRCTAPAERRDHAGQLAAGHVTIEQLRHRRPLRSAAALAKARRGTGWPPPRTGHLA